MWQLASNEELLDQLFTSEDRLKWEVVQEILRRGPELLPELTIIVSDRTLWTADLPQWWAPIHATYLLGALMTPEALPGLLSALRWADAYDNEWVVEDLPTMFGAVGEKAIDPLLQVLRDRTAGWSARSIALDAVAAVCLRHPQHEQWLIGVLRDIVRTQQEEVGVRRSAATILLDLRVHSAREDLLTFASEQEQMASTLPHYQAALTTADVERELSVAARSQDYYLRDWMRFYQADEMLKRQQSWEREDRALRTSGVMLGKHEFDLLKTGRGVPVSRDKLH